MHVQSKKKSHACHYNIKHFQEQLYSGRYNVMAGDYLFPKLKIWWLINVASSSSVVLMTGNYKRYCSLQGVINFIFYKSN